MLSLTLLTGVVGGLYGHAAGALSGFLYSQPKTR